MKRILLPILTVSVCTCGLLFQKYFSESGVLYDEIYIFTRTLAFALEQGNPEHILLMLSILGSSLLVSVILSLMAFPVLFVMHRDISGFFYHKLYENSPSTQ